MLVYIRSSACILNRWHFAIGAMRMTTERLHHAVRAALSQVGLFRSDVMLIVAVSGGPDSLCLLHVLWQLQNEQGPQLHVAHLDHGFRGEQSAAEARFVQQTAAAWGLPTTIARHDIPLMARLQRQNAHAIARQVRYAFLAAVAQAQQAHAVAVGHQADDQAETVLLHLLHGAGPAGLRGMRAVVPWPEWRQREWQGFRNDAMVTPDSQPRTHTAQQPASRPLLLRPLLSITRAEVEQYCQEYALTPQYDPSNQATRYRRGRIRSELLPYLATYNQHIAAALTRTAQICSDDYAYIQSQLDVVWPNLVEEQPDIILFDRKYWSDLPVVLQRYALRRAAQQLGVYDGLRYEQVEAGRQAALRATGYQHTLGANLLLRVEATHVGLMRMDRPGNDRTRVLRAVQACTDLPQLEVAQLPLPVPGTTRLGAGWQVTSSYTMPDKLPADNYWRWWVALDATTLTGSLVMRRRQPGDRFRPAGGRGSRKLQDFFVDVKLPSALRAAWPILATPTAIVWIAGLRADARFQATPATDHTLWVTLTRG